MNEHERAVFLRQIAAELRKLSVAEPKGGAISKEDNEAAHCLRQAFHLGAFASAQWYRFDYEYKHNLANFQDAPEYLAFHFAIKWLKEHPDVHRIPSPWPEGDPGPHEDLRYGCPLLAELIERDADTCQAATTESDKQPQFTYQHICNGVDISQSTLTQIVQNTDGIRKPQRGKRGHTFTYQEVCKLGDTHVAQNSNRGEHWSAYLKKYKPSS